MDLTHNEAETNAYILEMQIHPTFIMDVIIYPQSKGLNFDCVEICHVGSKLTYYQHRR